MPAPTRASGRRLLLLVAGLAVAGVALLAVGLVAFGVSRAASGGEPVPKNVTAGTAVIPATEKTLGSAEPSGTSSATSLTATTAPPATPAEQPAVAKQDGASLDAYRGLGSWIDIYDDRAWKDPAAAVADMATHGVKTLYLETGNSRSKGELFKPEQVRQFITEAHARDIKVVAWYLPDLLDPEKDYGRIDAAIKLTTSDGQKFDSFALDIESGAIKSQKPRNRALLALSRRIRSAVGPSYPLGAIIPSPVGLSRKGGYWVTFPYTDLAPIYDVFLPMGYYTYHGKGAALAYSDTVGNARILRAQKGCSAVQIHMIGGEAEKSSAAEVEAFVRGSRDAGCIGASLYGWAGTKAAHWQELAAFGSGAP
jgi:hypothetical protein